MMPVFMKKQLIPNILLKSNIEFSELCLKLCYFEKKAIEIFR